MPNEQRTIGTVGAETATRTCPARCEDGRIGIYQSWDEHYPSEWSDCPHCCERTGGTVRPEIRTRESVLKTRPLATFGRRGLAYVARRHAYPGVYLRRVSGRHLRLLPLLPRPHVRA